MPGSLTVSTDPVGTQAQHGAHRTPLHTRTHSLNLWLSIQIRLGFFLSNVAQTWTPASNRKKDECTAVQTSKKRIPKQLTHSGGRSSEEKNKRFWNVGCRALVLVSHDKENFCDQEGKKTRKKKHMHPSKSTDKHPSDRVRQCGKQTEQNIIWQPTHRWWKIHLQIIVNIKFWPWASWVKVFNRLLNKS